jgi:hypothetical protein
VGAGDEAGDASGSGSKLVACIRVSYIGPFRSLEWKRLHLKQSINHALNALVSCAFEQPLIYTPSKRHTPTDIDIRSISSHAQAEALVYLGHGGDTG